MVKVSVVIPTYNRAHLLPEAVVSVLAQTYRDFEVIVIDDGSTDNTREVAQSFPPVVKYFRQENRGLSAVRNKGIELARGEYILFLDSDDVLLEDALGKSVAFLDQHPEIAFCHGQFYTMDESGRPLRLRRARGPRATFVRDGRQEIAHLLFRSSIHPSTVLVRRSCFEEVGLFDTRLRFSEDWDMWLRMAKRYAVGHLAEPLAKIRFHGQSITAQAGVEVVQSAHAAVLESVLGDAELGPLYAHLRKKAYFSLYVLFASVAARRGRKGAGLRYLSRALKTCPGLLCERKGLSLLMDAAKDFLPRRPRRMIVQALMALRLR